MFRDAKPERRRELEERSLPALEAKTIEMSRLVDQMVEVARLEEGSLRLRADRVDLSTVADEAVPLAPALKGPPLPHSAVGPVPSEVKWVGDPEPVPCVLRKSLANALTS